MNIRTLVICASLFAAPVYADLATGILLGQALANTQNCNSSPIINNVENNGFISLPSSMIVQTGLHYYTCPTYPGYTAQSIYHVARKTPSKRRSALGGDGERKFA